MITEKDSSCIANESQENQLLSLLSAVNLGRISISIISLNFIAMAILAPKAFSYWFSALVNFERFRVIGGNNNSKKTCNQRRAVHRAYIWHSELAWWCPSLETSERIENSPTFHFFSTFGISLLLVSTSSTNELANLITYVDCRCPYIFS